MIVRKKNVIDDGRNVFVNKVDLTISKEIKKKVVISTMTREFSSVE